MTVIIKFAAVAFGNPLFPDPILGRAIERIFFSSANFKAFSIVSVNNSLELF